MFRATCSVILALAVMSSVAAAQSGDGPSVGLGIALNPIAMVDIDEEFGVLPLGFGNFTVPIRMGARARLEPELGIYRAKFEFSEGALSGESVQSILRYGVALHFMMTETDSFRPYLGPRVGFIRHSERQEIGGGGAPDETTRTDSYVGLAIGGEYWFTPRFSLGGELQINRVGIGDEESGDGPTPSSSSSYSIISNNGVIAVRLYLF